MAELHQEAQSAVVAEALRRMRVEERRREIIEGLIEDAAWQQEMAREGMAAAPSLND